MRDRRIDGDNQIKLGNQPGRIGEVIKLSSEIDHRERPGQLFWSVALLKAEKLNSRNISKALERLQVDRTGHVWM